MSELCELLCCPSSHAPESELSRRHEAHHGFVPKRRLRRGKNNKNLSNCNQMVLRDLFFVFLPLVLSEFRLRNCDTGRAGARACSQA